MVRIWRLGAFKKKCIGKYSALRGIYNKLHNEIFKMCNHQIKNKDVDTNGWNNAFVPKLSCIYAGWIPR